MPEVRLPSRSRGGTTAAVRTAFHAMRRVRIDIGAVDATPRLSRTIARHPHVERIPVEMMCSTMLRLRTSMDTWTSEALALRSDIRGVEATLTARIDDTEQRLSARIDHVAQQLRGEIADARRHSDVLYESLRDDIRLVAEGVAVIGAKVDRLTR
jgi:hypothetical protein